MNGRRVVSKVTGRITVALVLVAVLITLSGCSAGADSDAETDIGFLPDSVCWGIPGAHVAAVLGQDQHSETVDWYAYEFDTQEPLDFDDPDTSDDFYFVSSCHVFYIDKETRARDGFLIQLTPGNSRAEFWQAAQYEQLTATGVPLPGFVGSRSAWVELPRCVGDRLTFNAGTWGLSVTPHIKYNRTTAVPQPFQSSLAGAADLPVAWLTTVANHVRSINRCPEPPLSAPSVSAWSPAEDPIKDGRVCAVPVEPATLRATEVDGAVVQTSAGDMVCSLTVRGSVVLVYAELARSDREVLEHNSPEPLFTSDDPRMVRPPGDGVPYYPRLDLPLPDGSRAIFSQRCSAAAGSARLYLANAVPGNPALGGLRDELLTAAARRDGCPEQ